MEEVAKKGNLNKLTVTVLKTFCQANKIKSGTQKKADLIEAIKEHFGVQVFHSSKRIYNLYLEVLFSVFPTCFARTGRGNLLQWFKLEKIELESLNKSMESSHPAVFSK